MKESQLVTLNHSEGYELIEGITLTFNRSVRAKNISIRPKPEKNEIIITYPAIPFAKQQAKKFLKKKENWLWQIFKKHKDNGKDHNIEEITFGGKVKLFGKTYKVVQAERRGQSPINEEDMTIAISGDEQFLPRRLKTLQKNELDKYIKSRIEHYYHEISVLYDVNMIPRIKKYGKVTIRDTSSRWGSCASNGNLSFALKLSHYEPWVIDYVIAHELCHLIEMNHSDAFWSLVDQVYDNSVRLAKSKLKGVL
ncbi:MAG: M48 family metallopeptidase [Alphaproteobacteria bacterium]|jgi:predicted metal-dependent hydrolase|nr:M48 family metallopeptidase [Alphaproteobacteria bacterium]